MKSHWHDRGQLADYDERSLGTGIAHGPPQEEAEVILFGPDDEPLIVEPCRRKIGFV